MPGLYARPGSFRKKYWKKMPELFPYYCQENYMNVFLWSSGATFCENVMLSYYNVHKTIMIKVFLIIHDYGKKLYS